MEYMDEKIIKLKHLGIKQKYLTLESGIYAAQHLIQFEKIYIGEINISITLPSNFVTMPESIKKVKYQSESRPQLIKTSLDTGVNFTFTTINQDVSQEQVPMVLKQMKGIIQKTNPANIFYDAGSEVTVQDTLINWFDYKSYAIDEQIYNFMYLIPMSKHAQLHGCFNCKDDLKEDWKNIVLQVIKTIELGDTVGGNENEITKN